MQNYKKMPFNEEQYKIINGDSLVVLDTFPDNYFDACITDPPYGLTTITKRFGKSNSKPATTKNNDGSFARLSKGFMGKEWDGSGIEYNVDFWAKVYAKLKPGAYLLAFGGSRTFHRIACAIEDAGFEIRDTIMWLYGSGFPKSMNISKGIEAREKYGKADTRSKRVVEQNCDGESYTIKQTNNGAMGEIVETTRKEYKPSSDLSKKWDGWGTCLKPAYEPIIVARKPVEDSIINNVIKYGVGGINIDECRVGDEHFEITDSEYDNNENQSCFGNVKRTPKEYDGRFPANVILTYDETDKEEVCGGMPNTKSNGGEPNYDFGNQENPSHLYTNIKSGTHFDDEGSAARYFYCAKASKKDRDSGLDMLESKLFHRTRPDANPDNLTGLNKEGRFAHVLRKNIHPTVKPVELMQYLIRLVCPYGAIILDPFNGSGSTGKAVAFENREREKDYRYVGIELDKEYCEISKGRIDYALNKFEYDMIKDIKEEEQKTGQLSLFDIPTD